MRRRHDSPVAEEASIDLAPMLDIVFIMLIFFVVTTSFVKEAGIDVNRPSAQTAERKARGNILIAIAPDGALWIDKRPVDIRALRATVSRLHAENPEGSVIIQGDRDAQIGLLVAVMDQIRQAGISNVAIAADPDE